MLVRHHCLVALLAVASACASSSGTPAEGTTTGERASRNPNVITYAELQDPTVASTDAQTAIRQLRPAFFRTRGPQSFSNTSAGEVQISQDYGPLQQLSGLAAIPVRSLVEVRYLNAVEAQQRFGINANGGPVIILLSSRQ